MTQAFREEHDSLGPVEVPAERLWGAQTQRSLKYFSIGDDRMPKEMITAYAIVKKAAAICNQSSGRLDKEKADLIIDVCNELLAGEHQEEFPLFVWMTGSGTQFNMNMNEVISNRCCQITGTSLGSKTPVHPNDHVNMSQSTNDSFPTAMNIAVALTTTHDLLPTLSELKVSLEAKARQWNGIVKIGRTHLQDATPLTLGQEMSGYAALINDNITRINNALTGVMRLCLGGTAVGTGINVYQGFAEQVAAEISTLTGFFRSVACFRSSPPWPVICLRLGVMLASLPLDRSFLMYHLTTDPFRYICVTFLEAIVLRLGGMLASLLLFGRFWCII